MKKNPSPILVDILSFDNFFLETDIAHGLTFRGNQTRKIQKFGMDVVSG